MRKTMRRIGIFWKRVEPGILLMGVVSGVVIWAYTNFATAGQIGDIRAEVIAAKVELRTYVDQRHEEVKGQLVEIKEELGKQRGLQERILLEVRH